MFYLLLARTHQMRQLCLPVLLAECSDHAADAACPTWEEEEWRKLVFGSKYRTSGYNGRLSYGHNSVSLILTPALTIPRTYLRGLVLELQATGREASVHFFRETHTDPLPRLLESSLIPTLHGLFIGK